MRASAASSVPVPHEGLGVRDVFDRYDVQASSRSP